MELVAIDLSVHLEFPAMLLQDGLSAFPMGNPLMLRDSLFYVRPCSAHPDL
jgi:hypothetical protein